MAGELGVRDCAWCGACSPAQHTKHNGWFRNRLGEWFCCRSHRDQSNAALKRLRDKREQ